MKAGKFIHLPAILLALGLAGPPGLLAAEPGVELGEVVVVTGEVVGIDRADRDVAIMGPEGNVVVLEVGKAARNFDQIRLGDKVKLEYYEAVAIYVGAAGKPPEADAGIVAVAAPKGQKPAAEVVEVSDISAVIQGIDKAKRRLTLKGPQGNVVSVKVDKAVKAFDELKVGDSIHVRYTEAIAISVSKP